MGIQINGNTDSISAIDGNLSVQGNLGNLTGDLTGNVNSPGISTFSQLNVTQSNPTNLNVSGVTTVSVGSTVAPSISPTGNSSTGIFFPSSDAVAISYGGTEALRVDNSGNIQFDSGYGSVATVYGCRAWVNFNGSGTVAIRASGNVSSISDIGTGDYRVNFTALMSDANYATVVSVEERGTTVFTSSNDTFNQTTSQAVINVMLGNSAINYFDAEQVNVAIFR